MWKNSHAWVAASSNYGIGWIKPSWFQETMPQKQQKKSTPCPINRRHMIPNTYEHQEWANEKNGKQSIMFLFFWLSFQYVHSGNLFMRARSFLFNLSNWVCVSFVSVLLHQFGPKRDSRISVVSKNLLEHLICIQEQIWTSHIQNQIWTWKNTTKVAEQLKQYLKWFPTPGARQHGLEERDVKEEPGHLQPAVDQGCPGRQVAGLALICIDGNGNDHSWLIGERSMFINTSPDMFG